jgi:hypothetical protein
MSDQKIAQVGRTPQYNDDSKTPEIAPAQHLEDEYETGKDHMNYDRVDKASQNDPYSCL